MIEPIVLTGEQRDQLRTCEHCHGLFKNPSVMRVHEKKCPKNDKNTMHFYRRKTIDKREKRTKKYGDRFTITTVNLEVSTIGKLSSLVPNKNGRERSLLFRDIVTFVINNVRDIEARFKSGDYELKGQRKTISLNLVTADLVSMDKIVDENHVLFKNRSCLIRCGIDEWFERMGKGNALSSYR